VNSRASHGRGGHSPAHEGAERLLEGRLPQRAPPAATVACVGTFNLTSPAAAGSSKRARGSKAKSSGLTERAPCGKELHVLGSSFAGVSSEGRKENASFKAARVRAEIAGSTVRGKSVARSLHDTSNTEATAAA
jgi:hypothetical protein